MPTSPSIHQCLPLTHSSTDNSLECGTDTKMGFDKRSETDFKKSVKRHIRRSNSFYRKHSLRTVTNKNNKRRYTFSGSQETKIVFKKRRRLSSIAWPTKFLFGGDRTDPLNLRSLEDEAANSQLNVFSPKHSPARQRYTQVQVVIPHNIHDPLNLNSGEETAPKATKLRKRRRHRKSRREDAENQKELKDSTEELSDHHLCASPVKMLFEDSSFKTTSHSIIKENDNQKQVLKRRRSKSRFQKVKFRANAEKFCYGNHITSHNSWNFDGSSGDPRIRFFNTEFFSGKNVLDIGCNSGKLTLLIAKHFYPSKITGIDIDKKLINIAERQLRNDNSCTDMPKSMSLLYGPLAKVLPVRKETNVAFLEANYVPACEDYLETQKPEYDTILCLRVTKWIHLNFGDEGLKMTFKRIYAQLRFGGQLILEPQPWFTYSSSKRITPSIYKTYCGLKMRPDTFCDFLLSSEVGFSSCEVIGKIANFAKGYRHTIYLLTKDYHPNADDLIINRISPIPFHKDQWNPESDDSCEYACEYMNRS